MERCLVTSVLAYKAVFAAQMVDELDLTGKAIAKDSAFAAVHAAVEAVWHFMGVLGMVG